MSSDLQQHSSILPSTERTAPISPGQERLLAAEYQLEDGTFPTGDSSGSLRPVDALAVDLCGPLQLSALSYAVNELRRRQASLRTTFRFPVQAPPFQLVAVHRPFPLQAELLDKEDGKSSIAALMEVAGAAPRHPADDELFRARIFRQSADHHILLLQIHHLISDGWSVGLMCEELTELYRAAAEERPAQLPPLSSTFADLCVWMWQERRSTRLQKQLERACAEFPSEWPPLPFPSHSDRETALSSAGARDVMTEPLEISAGQLSQLRQRRGQGAHTGLAAPVLAAISLALSAATGRSEVRIGMMVANRARPEAEHLIGYFVNTAIVQTVIEPSATIGELVDRTNSQVMRAIQGQEVPIQDVVANLRRGARLGDAEPYQVTLALNNAHQKELKLEGFDCTTTDLGHYGPRRSATKIHQRWAMDETDHGVSGTMTFRTDSMNAHEGAAAVASFLQALGAMSSTGRLVGEILSELPAPATRFKSTDLTS